VARLSAPDAAPATAADARPSALLPHCPSIADAATILPRSQRSPQTELLPRGNSGLSRLHLLPVHANHSNMVSPSMLTSITARTVNQKTTPLGIPNRFNQSEIDSRGYSFRTSSEASAGVNSR